MKVRTNNSANQQLTQHCFKNWGMYSAQGNQAMKRKAESLLKNLVKAQAKNGDLSTYIKCFEKYIKSYAKSCKSKICQEATDTEVRNIVWGFVSQTGQAVNVPTSILDTIWRTFV